MIDLHSHILYGLDDGAKSRDESVAMLQIADASGTTDIVATPHANGQYEFRPDLIAERIAELQPYSQVRIHAGCDFHLSAKNIDAALRHPEQYTIARSNYLLVEFPELSRFQAAGEIFRRLIEAGLIPIISHPERNEHLRTHEDDLARFVEMGCFVQVTAASITGLFGPDAKRSALRLLERGLAHIVASDAHETKRRTPDLRAAYEAIAVASGEPFAAACFRDIPAAVLANDVIELPERPARRPRRWYQFWKTP